MPLAARRFPPPWTAEVTPNCFIVRDANGQALSYVYYESEAHVCLRTGKSEPYGPPARRGRLAGALFSPARRRAQDWPRLA
jgi:hypothetical protein